MNNVLKKTIREEIEKYNKEKGEGSKSESILPAAPKAKKEIQSSTDQEKII